MTIEQNVKLGEQSPELTEESEFADTQHRALIWRCMSADESNQKKYGRGCNKFSVRWTKKRSGNSKDRFQGLCRYCRKRTSLHPEIGSIVKWMDNRKEAINLAEMMNTGMI